MRPGLTMVKRTSPVVKFKNDSMVIYSFSRIERLTARRQTRMVKVKSNLRVFVLMRVHQ